MTLQSDLDGLVIMAENSINDDLGLSLHLYLVRYSGDFSFALLGSILTSLVDELQFGQLVLELLFPLFADVESIIDLEVDRHILLRLSDLLALKEGDQFALQLVLEEERHVMDCFVFVASLADAIVRDVLKSHSLI